MKNFRTLSIVISTCLCLNFVSLSGCSSDDGESVPEVANTCQVSGEIDNSLVGTWTGEIYFNSNNQSYNQTHRFRSDGTFLATGNALFDTSGCWRVVDNQIRYIGTFRESGRTVTANFNGRIITPDSIQGTASTDTGENGTIWMTR